MFSAWSSSLVPRRSSISESRPATPYSSTRQHTDYVPGVPTRALSTTPRIVNGVGKSRSTPVPSENKRGSQNLKTTNASRPMKLRVTRGRIKHRNFNFERPLSTSAGHPIRSARGNSSGRASGAPDSRPSFMRPGPHGRYGSGGGRHVDDSASYRPRNFPPAGRIRAVSQDSSENSPRRSVTAFPSEPLT